MMTPGTMNTAHQQAVQQPVEQVAAEADAEPGPFAADRRRRVAVRGIPRRRGDGAGRRWRRPTPGGGGGGGGVEPWPGGGGGGGIAMHRVLHEPGRRTSERPVTGWCVGLVEPARQRNGRSRRAGTGRDHQRPLKRHAVLRGGSVSTTTTGFGQSASTPAMIATTSSSVGVGDMLLIET